MRLNYKKLIVLLVFIIIISQSIYIYSVKPKSEVFYTPAFEASYSKQISLIGNWDVQALSQNTRGEYILYPLLHIFSVVLFDVAGVDFFTSFVIFGAFLSILNYFIFYVACKSIFNDYLASACALAFLAISDFTHFLWSNAIRETFADTLFLVCLALVFLLFKTDSKKIRILVFVAILGVSFAHPLASLIFMASMVMLELFERRLLGTSRFKYFGATTFFAVIAWYLYVGWAYALNYQQMFNSILAELTGNGVTQLSVVSFDTGGTLFFFIKLSALAVGALCLLVQIGALLLKKIHHTLVSNLKTLLTLWLILFAILSIFIYAISRLLPWGSLPGIADSATRFEPYLFIGLGLMAGLTVSDLSVFKTILSPLKRIHTFSSIKPRRIHKNVIAIIAICLFLGMNLIIFPIAPTIKMLSDASNSKNTDNQLIYGGTGNYVSTQMNGTTLTSSNELVYTRHLNSLFASSSFIANNQANSNPVYISSRFADISLEAYYRLKVIDIRDVGLFSSSGLYLNSPMDGPVYQFNLTTFRLNNYSVVYSNGLWSIYYIDC